MNESKVMPCGCSHSYQDQKYGRQMRFHNPFKGGFRCTVCAHEVIEDKPKQAEKKKK